VVNELPIIVVLLGLGALVTVERWRPAHPCTPRRGWYARAALVNGLNVAVFFPFDGLISHFGLRVSVFDLSHLPPFAGACAAYLVFTFVVYWWHRLRHHNKYFWRYFHQLHHSPGRIESLTAYYIHPLDMIANLTISNVIVFYILGLTIESAGWYTVITGLAGLLIHANIRMPRAVGYVFQTPEMHRLHHKSDHHASNYSDIVWWDMLFGTYQNPITEIADCGFSEDSKTQLMRMLAGRDLSQVIDSR
jgi:sterol desaturase/sphingolipid hydroxylase (fatty acid hydroxylase superfamily)